MTFELAQFRCVPGTGFKMADEICLRDMYLPDHRCIGKYVTKDRSISKGTCEP